MALKMAKELWMIVVLAVALGGATATNFCKQVVEPIGYGCTEFSVQTEDGFVLVLHRLERIGSVLVKDNETSAACPPDHSGNVETEKHKPHSKGRRAECVSPPASSVDPASRTVSSSGDSNGAHDGGSTQGAASSASGPSSQIQAPAVLGSGPTADQSSGSLNRTSENASSQQPAAAAGPGPSKSTQNASRSSSAPTSSGIPSSNYTANPGAGKGSPVLLMNVEFLNGDSWFQNVDVDQRVSSLLPILLLEDGFDVWIGHQRATFWGHGHVRLNYTDREYWNWSWDEHVQFDLPVQLRFILTETNQPVHFIGASQAATVAAAGATDHETAKMFRSLTLIGPAAFPGNSNSMLLNAWAYIFGAILDSQYYATGFQNGAFNYTREFPQTGPISGMGLTGLGIGLITGPNCCLGSTSIQFTNGWDGTTSFKNLLHWQQGIRTDDFARYDYGSAARNIQAYGKPAPTPYVVAQIPSHLPVLVIAGGRDWVAPPRGINKLVSQLQQPATIVNITNYAHFDLFFSARRETDVYMPILEFLEGSKFE